MIGSSMVCVCVCVCIISIIVIKFLSSSGTTSQCSHISSHLFVSAENQKSACDLETVSHDRCPDNVYERKEHSPPENPCYPHKKERYEL